jgi:large subunit ribosomal protein L24
MQQYVGGKIRIRKGDTVMVVAGRERGKTGKVLALDPSTGHVTVEKLNIIKRHTKPNQKARQGGILEREAPLAISNVMLYCANCQKPIRVGIKISEDGRRMRICRKCQEVLEKA